ncbi:hypothetical protein ACFQAS_02565 [Halopenitus salinus]|uniref:Uncharacterized protein n=1 Tax=Halopenitus salinus TaxID=1198295 RepID=A0ABD5UQZ2_9EURY
MIRRPPPSEAFDGALATLDGERLSRETPAVSARESRIDADISR